MKNNTLATKNVKKIELDFSKPAEELINQITKTILDLRPYLDEGVTLNFILKKKGEKSQNFVYNLNKDNYLTAQRDAILPYIIEEILKKEFPHKVAVNKKLVGYIVDELKRDPYWTKHLVTLVKAIDNQELD